MIQERFRKQNTVRRKDVRIVNAMISMGSVSMNQLMNGMKPLSKRIIAMKLFAKTINQF